MYQIDLTAIPSQKTTFTLDSTEYTIRMYPLDDDNIMAIDISINGVTMVQGLKVVPNQLLLYPYQQTGNFIFSTQNEELINYLNFGVTQFLYYVTVEELANV